MRYPFSLVCAFITLALFKIPSLSQNPEPLFLSVLEGRIATDAGFSRGVAWGDFDNDGDADLYIANSAGQWNAIYCNNGNGSFSKSTDFNSPLAETVSLGGNSEGVNWVDYDNDGDLDLFVLNRGDEPHFLFRNDNLIEFIRIKEHTLTQPGISASMACWADIEGDGDLDVIMAGYDHPNRAFRNLGSGEFEEVVIPELILNQQGNARACACADANHDGLPEFYVANARSPNLYLENLGNWKFKSILDGHLVHHVGYSYGVSWADYDDDGDLDLFVANFDTENHLYQNDGNGILIPDSVSGLSSIRSGASKGHTWGDYDLDGDLDLFIANGTYKPDMHNFLFLNRGDGTFNKTVSGVIASHADTSAGVSHADYDRDGDLDLFVANWGGRDQINRFYQNQTNSNNWVSFQLRGSSSNSYGIGAKVKLTLVRDQEMKTMYRWVYPVTGYGSQNDYELHFGTGNYDRIDSVTIYWPSGQSDSYNTLEAGKRYRVIEATSLLEW